MIIDFYSQINQIISDFGALDRIDDGGISPRRATEGKVMRYMYDTNDRLVADAKMDDAFEVRCLI